MDSTEFRQSPERFWSPRVLAFGRRNMSPVHRCYSNAQDIKDQHSSSTNEVPLALGSAARRGHVSVLAMNRAMRTLQLLWVAMLVYWLSCN